MAPREDHETTNVEAAAHFEKWRSQAYDLQPEEYR